VILELTALSSAPDFSILRNFTICSSENLRHVTLQVEEAQFSAQLRKWRDGGRGERCTSTEQPFCHEFLLDSFTTAVINRRHALKIYSLHLPILTPVIQKTYFCTRNFNSKEMMLMSRTFGMMNDNEEEVSDRKPASIFAISLRLQPGPERTYRCTRMLQELQFSFHVISAYHFIYVFCFNMEPRGIVYILSHAIR
jgi:hypothetical protein